MQWQEMEEVSVNPDDITQAAQQHKQCEKTCQTSGFASSGSCAYGALDMPRPTATRHTHCYFLPFMKFPG